MGEWQFDFVGAIWLYPGKGGWRFVTLPHEIGAELRFLSAVDSRPWRSAPVAVRIGKSEWRTSVFPDKESQSYVLPLKASIRASEALTDGQDVRVRLRLLAG